MIYHPSISGTVRTSPNVCGMTSHLTQRHQERLVLDLGLNYDQVAFRARGVARRLSLGPGFAAIPKAKSDRNSFSRSARNPAMDYDIVIANGTVVSAEGESRADVAIRGEKIAAVGRGLDLIAGPKAEIVDATGRLVIPGGVDVHVHLELPFCGTVSSDDWKTGTRAAARGGVTTVIDFAIPYGTETLIDAYENWMARAKPKACVDYCFHMAITNWDRHGPEMKKMVARGCPTFKEFMIYASEGWQADDRTIFNTLERAKQLGAMLLVHAESSRVLDELIDRY